MELRPCSKYIHCISHKNMPLDVLNFDNVSAYCAPGSYSDTGLAPCIKCPATHYQPMEGQILCLHCGALKRALDVGSTVATECKGTVTKFNLTNI